LNKLILLKSIRIYAAVDLDTMMSDNDKNQCWWQKWSRPRRAPANPTGFWEVFSRFAGVEFPMIAADKWLISLNIFNYQGVDTAKSSLMLIWKPYAHTFWSQR